MFLLMYGSGLRHRECRTLRVKDVCFQSRQIVVRDGKGMKDRVTVLADCVLSELQRQLEWAKYLHCEDLAQGLGRVLPAVRAGSKIPQRRSRVLLAVRASFTTAVKGSTQRCSQASPRP
ncbi:tyrosine-type recombinase/integrase [Rubripirellula sp.]|nr:tyrosine-type recombinase/integrase [Rubripirellula sp.]